MSMPHITVVVAVCETCFQKAILLEIGDRIEGNPVCLNQKCKSKEKKGKYTDGS